ncbi:MAG: hypothetical protein LUD07_08355 [Clostridiales bacterium]|nr:hypothetical protein [Clostridiales bacterium]
MTTILCYFMLICVATLCISLVAGTIQSMYNEYKRDKRAEAQEKRDTEYHLERMKREKDEAAHDLEYHEKLMKSLN